MDASSFQSARRLLERQHHIRLYIELQTLSMLEKGGNSNVVTEQPMMGLPDTLDRDKCFMTAVTFCDPYIPET